MYGEVEAKQLPSRDVLLAEQADLKQRAEQIQYVLSHIPPEEVSYQRQELQRAI